MRRNSKKEQLEGVMIRSAIRRFVEAGMSVAVLTASGPEGIALYAFVTAIVDVLTERHPNEVRLHAELARIRSSDALRKANSLENILRTIAGVAEDSRPEIEQLADAVRDPDGAEKSALLEQAVLKVFTG